MSTGEREASSRVVELCSGPGGRVVTLRARRRESS